VVDRVVDRWGSIGESGHLIGLEFCIGNFGVCGSSTTGEVVKSHGK
jgi:hypothetical protein